MDYRNRGSIKRFLYNIFTIGILSPLSRKNKLSPKKKTNANVTYIDSCWDEIQKENGYKK